MVRRLSRLTRDSAHPSTQPLRNSALFHVVITRMRHDQPTGVYVARRRAEGKTLGEVVRILKRYAAREVFKHLPRPT